ncbi:conserved oligomeric Golgi complex subunit 6 [Dorcoceras hygrometricum]|uniref:Conserved oligomeric Golgi complex subunit 6 n=1 Tax=Dorcoceras hygrometricum TaxID=472368 RepID=A0A2Z7B645_9LAMI|nr:conserved oligomeric Golgi complex subunit 6 [Dorcoceras hygrometricum]
MRRPWRAAVERNGAQHAIQQHARPAIVARQRQHASTMARSSGEERRKCAQQLARGGDQRSPKAAHGSALPALASCNDFARIVSTSRATSAIVMRRRVKRAQHVHAMKRAPVSCFFRDKRASRAHICACEEGAPPHVAAADGCRRNFDCGRYRQSGPRPEPRLLHQPVLEALTNSARTDSPRRVGRKQLSGERSGGGGGGGL